MSDTVVQPSGPIAAFTIADGGYLIGAAALVNSLYRGGYRGVFWIGYRGELPAWADRTVARANWRELQAAPDLLVRFVALSGQDTLALAKADFGLMLLDELAPESSGVIFFDADIVALAGWSYFLDWMKAGVGICTERLPFKHRNHPHRFHWREMIAAVGRVAQDSDLYFNSGFLAVPRQHREILEAWSSLIAEYRRRIGQTIPGVRYGDRLNPLWGTDQEMLNAAVMSCDLPFSILGPEGMNFAPLSLYMSHAIGRKPWDANYLREALGGYPPGRADRHFWQFADQPIPALSSGTQRRRRLFLKIAAGIGRFYSRSSDA